jgi:hypothetical protein
MLILAEINFFVLILGADPIKCFKQKRRGVVSFLL